MALIEIEVEDVSQERLDKYIASKTNLSRSMVQKLAKQGRILLNNQKIKASELVNPGDIIKIDKPAPEKIKLTPETFDLDIIYEDRYLLVINKPQGMVVHPSKGHVSGTLVHGLLNHCQDLSGIGGQIRPGIVHRLDKDTSGLLLVAKDDLTHQKLGLALEKHEIQRIYVALVKGRWDLKTGTISAPIARHPKKRTCMAVVPNGRKAITHFQVLHLFDNCSFVRLQLETGRTHQIRVHLAYVGHPVLGDAIYNNASDETDKLLLHAAKLKFIHPISGENMCFVAKLPLIFRKRLEELY